MTATAQPTPGPWGSRRLSTGIVITANGKDICKVPLNRYVSNDANEANARLIIAAPNLLVALKAAREKLQIEAGGAREYKGGMPTQILFPMIDAALAKATP
jgi:hypothetical protein